MQQHSSQHNSVWLASKPPPSFPQLREDVHADVCIVGAGMAGISCAYMLASTGKSIVLLEAEKVTCGESGRTTAHLTNAVDDRYCEIEKIHGPEGAKLVAESHTQAINTIERIIQQENIDCEFERVNGYLFLPNHHSERILDEELEAALRAGLVDVEKVAQLPINVNVGPALRFGGQAQFHPLKYLHALLAKIQEKQGRVFCNTHAHKVEEKNHHLEVLADNGSRVSAHAVIIATNTPFNDVVVIHTKQAAYRTYVVGLSVPRGLVPHALYWDEPRKVPSFSHPLEPYHYMRVCRSLDPREEILLVGGEDHKVGQADDADVRFAKLEQWARTYFPECGEVKYQWSGQVMEPVDGVAFIGKNPMDHSNVYVVTGDSGMGMTHGTIAGILLTDLICGQKNDWEKLYAPSRKTLQAVWRFARENSNVALQYTEWLKPVHEIHDLLAGLAADSGVVLQDGLKKIAVYRDRQSNFYARSASCTHLGCVIKWNSSEKSWDCPCHGSRFNPYGKVIHGPATHDLAFVNFNPNEYQDQQHKEVGMKSIFLKKALVSAAFLLLLGTPLLSICAQSNTVNPTPNSSTATSTGTVNNTNKPSTYGTSTTTNPSTQPDANVEENKRDVMSRNYSSTTTNSNQQAIQADRDLVTRINQALKEDNSLSMLSKNITVTAVGGRITLRGHLDSAADRDRLLAKIRGISGVTTVDDEIQILARR